MRYLYGDSSTFPLNENFVETLAAATDCAVALLEIDERIERARHTAAQANSAAMSELADIEQLVQRVEQALGQRDHLSVATAKVVEQVSAGAKAQFDRARAGIKSWCEATVRKSTQGCGPADVVAPVHRFMVRHQLPYSSWGLRWKSGSGEESTQAQVYGIMQRGLTVTLGVAITPKHPWAQPVRVGQLEKDVSIQLVGKSWLGREKLRDEVLEKMFVTRITRTADKHAFVISRKPRDPSPGLRFNLKEGDVKRVTVQRIDQHDQPVGEPATLESVDALKIKKLWRRIEETIADLVIHRSHLLEATLYGKRITELESPAVIAVAVIQAVAPLVRDMARHSRTPGELQLKRDLGDGRREELFISAPEIVGKYARLTPKNRELFACFGLDDAEMPASEVVPRRPRPPALAASSAAPPGGFAMLPPPPSAPSEHHSAQAARAPAFPALPPARPAAQPVSARLTSSIPPPQAPRRRSEEPCRSTSGEYRLPPPSVPPPRRRASLRVANG